MAVRTMIENGLGSVGDIAAVKLDNDGKLSETAVGLVISVLKGIMSRLNGELTFGDAATGTRCGNFSAQHITILTPPIANTEFIVPHGLGRSPVGYWPIEKDRAADLYTSSKGSWNDTLLYLKCDVASATVALIVF